MGSTLPIDPSGVSDPYRGLCEEVPARLQRAYELSQRPLPRFQHLDMGFLAAQAEAQDRCDLFQLETQHPGRTVVIGCPPMGFMADGELTERTPIEHLVSARLKARARQDWPEADRLRVMARTAGYELGDQPGGTEWIWIGREQFLPWIHEAEIDPSTV